MTRRRLVLATALVAAGLGWGAAEFHARARIRAEFASPLYASAVETTPARMHQLPPGGAPRALALAPTLRIDGGVGAIPHFGRLSDVAPSRSGDTLYVLDQMEARVYAFARDGHLLFDFGGKGPGPGEFRTPTHLLVLPWSGEVAVWDHEAQRLTIHAPDGSRPRTIDPAREERLTTSRTVVRMAAFASGFVMEVHADPLEVRPEQQRGALVRLDTALGNADTLIRFRVAGVRAWHVETAAGSSATTWLNPPVFSPVPSWDVLDGGAVLFAPGGPAEAYQLAAGGALGVRWRKPPQRITRGDRLRRLAGEIDTRILRVPKIPLAFLETLHRRFFARVRPSVTGVLAGPGGDVWVRRFDTTESWEGHARTWDRAAWDGTGRAPVRLPPHFRPLRIVDGLIYGIAFDETYVDRVEIYRISNGGPP